MKVKTLMWSKTDTIIHTKKPFYGGDTLFQSLGTCALGFFFCVCCFRLLSDLLGGAGVSAAPLGLNAVFTINQLLYCFDAVALGRSLYISIVKPKPSFPILKTSAKSVQTTAEVCADYTCSLYRLRLKSPESTTYSL